jgi:hypothetical protein
MKITEEIEKRNGKISEVGFLPWTLSIGISKGLEKTWKFLKGFANKPFLKDGSKTGQRIPRSNACQKQLHMYHGQKV